MFNSRQNGIITIPRAQYKNWCNSNRNLSALSSNSLVTPISATSSTITPTTTTAFTQDKGRSFPLPPELLIEILSYLGDSQPSLYSASLVCKQWLYCVAPILYCHPQIFDTYRWATFILTLTRDRMSFFYGDLIRSIDLSSGKSIEAMKDQEFYRRLSGEPLQQQQQRAATAATAAVTTAITANGGTPPLNRLSINIRSNDPVTTASIIDHNASIRYHQEQQQQQQQDYLIKGLPFIHVSTSSLMQIAHTCKNITSLNLSYTSLLYDSLIVETGEYLSTLQKYAVQPGLTHVQISIERAIEAIGKECIQLREVKVQRCEWVTAHMIWMFVYYCPNLKKLDARRSTKCTVKRLIGNVLEEDVPSPSVITPVIHNIHHHRRQLIVAARNLVAATNNDNNDTTTLVGTQTNAGARTDSTIAATSSSTSTNDIHNDYHNLLNEINNMNQEMDDIDEEEVLGQVQRPQNENQNQNHTHNHNHNHNGTVHFRFNNGTGLYEQVNTLQPPPNDISITPLNHPNNDNNNDAFWFVPFATTATTVMDEEMHPIGRRPPSPIHPHNNAATINDGSVGSTNKSLKKIVHEILTDAKDLGAIDLNWLQGY